MKKIIEFIFTKLTKIKKDFFILLDYVNIWISEFLIFGTAFSYILYLFDLNFVLLLWLDMFSLNGLIVRLIVIAIGIIFRILGEFYIFQRLGKLLNLKKLIVTSIIITGIIVGNKYVENIKIKTYAKAYDIGYNKGFNKGKDKYYYTRHNEGYNKGYEKGKEIGYSNASVELRANQEESEINQEDIESSYNDGFKNGYDLGYKEGKFSKTIEDNKVIDTKYFNIGDTKERVKAIMGTPTSIDVFESLNEELWHYDLSSITFKNGIVKEYNNYGDLLVE